MMAITNLVGNTCDVINYDLDNLTRLVEWVANAKRNQESVSVSSTDPSSDGVNSLFTLVGVVNALGNKYNKNESQTEKLQDFLDCFYILAAEILAVFSVYENHTLSYNRPQARKACGIIAEFILKRLGSTSSKNFGKEIDNPSEESSTNLTKVDDGASEKITPIGALLSEDEKCKYFLAVLSTFCSGIPSLETPDRERIIDSLKNIPRFPEGFIFTSAGRQIVNVEQAMPSYGNTGIEVNISGSSEMSGTSTVSSVVTSPYANFNTTRPQTDLTSLLLGQLCSPIEELLESSANLGWVSMIPPPPMESLPADRNLHVSNIIQPTQEQQQQVK